MTTPDLTTKEGRGKALDQINRDCLKAFNEAKVILAHNAVCIVNDRLVEIVVREGGFGSKSKKIMFASDVRIYCNHDTVFGERLNELSVGSSGGFTPADEASYWRTVHAARILENWDNACRVVNEYCEKYRNLIKEMENQSQSS